MSEPGPSPSRSPPTLVVVADPEGRGARLFGESTAERLIRQARSAGFERVLLGPGVHAESAGAESASPGDPVHGPALVLWDDTVIDDDRLAALARIVPSEDRATLYGHGGRPVGSLHGELARVPDRPVVGEAFDGFEATAGDRLIDGGDVRRVELRLLQAADPLAPRRWIAIVRAPWVGIVSSRRRALTLAFAMAATSVLVVLVGSGALATLIGLVGLAWVRELIAISRAYAGPRASRSEVLLLPWSRAALSLSVAIGDFRAPTLAAGVLAASVWMLHVRAGGSPARTARSGAIGPHWRWWLEFDAPAVELALALTAVVDGAAAVAWVSSALGAASLARLWTSRDSGSGEAEPSLR